MASTQDFTEEAQKHIENKMGIYLSLLFDLNGDGGFHDVAVIVVDTTKNSPDKFRIVLFSQPKNQQKYEPTWILTDNDLSNAILTRASARLFLTRYYEDGSHESCVIVKDKRYGKYTCEQKNF